MAKRDILKEAIADAKAVKETAIANAKAALEEAFTPQLKSMLSAKLEEMELDEEKTEIEEMTEKEKEEGDDREDGGESKETKRTEKMKYGKDLAESDIDEEINLDELLNEIESELEEEETVTEDARTDAEEEGYEDGMEDEKEDMEDEESTDLDLEDMTDEDLKLFIEDVIADMVSSGELEAGDEFEEEEEDMEVMSDDSEEIDIDIEDDETVEVSEDNSLAEVYKEVEKLKEDLEKSNDTVTTLSNELNEVNLLNAKLLYTNKIFKAKSLTENEKVKVLGAFDKATTVKETKLVFETLNEGLKTKKSPIRESLGSASKATGNFKTKKPIIKTDPMVARFQKLAGLK